MKCKHNYRVSSRCAKTITFECEKCKNKDTRELTESEQKLVDEEWADRSQYKHTDAVNEIFNQKSKYNQNHNVYGDELITLLEKYVEENPDCKIVWCDDDHFTISMLLFLPHLGTKGYWGTTVIYVPQNSDGGEPRSFFMYPNHLNRLVKVACELQKIQKENPYKRTSVWSNFPYKND